MNASSAMFDHYALRANPLSSQIPRLISASLGISGVKEPPSRILGRSEAAGGPELPSRRLCGLPARCSGSERVTRLCSGVTLLTDSAVGLRSERGAPGSSRSDTVDAVPEARRPQPLRGALSPHRFSPGKSS